MLDLAFTHGTSGTALEKETDKWRQRPGDKGGRHGHLAAWYQMQNLAPSGASLLKSLHESQYLG